MAVRNPYAEYQNSKIMTASPAELTLMLYEGAKALDVGMGVCVDVSDGVPDYRIIRIEQWAHTRATLEKIPDGRRI